MYLLLEKCLLKKYYQESPRNYTADARCCNEFKLNIHRILDSGEHTKSRLAIQVKLLKCFRTDFCMPTMDKTCLHYVNLETNDPSMDLKRPYLLATKKFKFQALHGKS